MATFSLFVRNPGGQIDVNLSPFGREFVRTHFNNVVDSASDTHVWHGALRQPIDPTKDADDPALLAERDNATLSAAQLSVLTVDDEHITDAEAWAWLTTLQLALRATASLQSLATDEDVDALSDEEAFDVRSLQSLLFELAACLDGGIPEDD